MKMLLILTLTFITSTAFAEVSKKPLKSSGSMGTDTPVGGTKTSPANASRNPNNPSPSAKNPNNTMGTNSPAAPQTIPSSNSTGTSTHTGSPTP